jgi:hypothetical protein
MFDRNSSFFGTTVFCCANEKYYISRVPTVDSSSGMDDRYLSLAVLDVDLYASNGTFNNANTLFGIILAIFIIKYFSCVEEIVDGCG